jgi:hypothetical protein
VGDAHQLGARADAELAGDLVEVVGDGPRRDEQPGGDLAVADALADGGDDLQLLGGELVERAGVAPAGGLPRGAELATGALGPCRRGCGGRSRSPPPSPPDAATPSRSREDAAQRLRGGVPAHCRLAMVYATSRRAASLRRSLTNRWISRSALVAASRQAEEAVGRTTTDVTGAGAGWVAGGRVVVAPAGSPLARLDPSTTRAPTRPQGPRPGDQQQPPPSRPGRGGRLPAPRVTHRPGRPAGRGAFRPWSRRRSARRSGPACRPAP